MTFIKTQQAILHKPLTSWVKPSDGCIQLPQTLGIIRLHVFRENSLDQPQKRIDLVPRIRALCVAELPQQVLERLRALGLEPIHS